MMVVTVLAGLLGVVSSLLIVNEYGIVGVATTVAFSMAFQNILAWHLTYKKTGLFTHMKFIVSPYSALLAVKRLRSLPGTTS